MKQLIKTMFKENKVNEIDIQRKFDEVEMKRKAEIKEKLEWEYKYKIANNILTKSSVTKIKTMKMDLVEEKTHEYNVPEFLKEQIELTGAQKGTIIHLILQNLEENINYNEEKIRELIEKMRSKKIITEKESLSVDTKKILEFTKTNIWKEMQSAKEVQKEKPFYINIPAKEIYNEEIDEDILVQGVIDLYYITKEGKLILVDYKTNKVKEKNELISEYKEQLKIYKEALEKALSKKVDKIYIYSTYLGEEIEVVI